MKKFEEEKARGLQSFIDKVQMKQDAEQSALHQKMQSNYGTFKRERALQFEQMVLKYKNKTKEFEDRLKHDTKNFSRILKGTHSNLSFII